MTVMNYRDALGDALLREMQRDPRVVCFGEDTIGGTGCAGESGGAWGATRDLNEVLPRQIWDAPITESAFVGAAVGAAATGLRPVVDILFVDFVGVCYDQLLNQASKLRFMSGGKASVPLVVRALTGAGMRRGAQHSAVLAPLFAHLPGLKVLAPATPADAKGLLAAAIRDDDPVVVLEPKMLYFQRGEVPDGDYIVPIGVADTIRPGDDITIVALGGCRSTAVAAAELLSAEGIAAEVIDPRTLAPLDTETIIASVRRTGGLVVVDESYPVCSLASEITAVVAEAGVLRTGARRITTPAVPTPFSPPLEDACLPTARDIAAAAAEILGKQLLRPAA
ncbi:MAG: transketolase C-terminal domain-containing protein [Tetrasphaera sp.]